MYERPHCSVSSTTFNMVSLPNCSHSNGHIVVSFCGLNLHFPMDLYISFWIFGVTFLCEVPQKVLWNKLDAVYDKLTSFPASYYIRFTESHFSSLQFFPTLSSSPSPLPLSSHTFPSLRTGKNLYQLEMENYILGSTGQPNLIYKTEIDYDTSEGFISACLFFA